MKSTFETSAKYSNKLDKTFELQRDVSYRAISVSPRNYDLCRRKISPFLRRVDSFLSKITSSSFNKIPRQSPKFTAKIFTVDKQVFRRKYIFYEFLRNDTKGTAKFAWKYAEIKGTWRQSYSCFSPRGLQSESRSSYLFIYFVFLRNCHFPCALFTSNLSNHSGNCCVSISAKDKRKRNVLARACFLTFAYKVAN